MATFWAAYSGKSAWHLDLDVWETSPEPWNNRSYVNWALYIYRGNGDTPYNNSGTPMSVAGPGGFNGTFNAFRFGSSGTGANYSGTGVGGRVQIASGGGWVTHNADGSGGVYLSAYHDSQTTLGAASVPNSYFGLSKLTQAPGTPTNVAATRVSDTQATLTWQNNYPSNGAPETNDFEIKNNNSGWTSFTTLSATSSATISTAPNQKLEFHVRAWNSGAGVSAWSASTAPIYTTPGAPTNATATKQANLDIAVAFTENVAYTEHEHEVWHGTVSGGTTTWDAAPLATLASGVTSYTHVAPSASQVHVYRVRAKAGSPALYSAYATTSSVQLLVAPNAPTWGNNPDYADRAAALDVTWVHNSVDTSPQSAYELSTSTDGGTTWVSSGKVASTTSKRTLAASTYAANAAVTMRVRTWGAATTGGSDGTGASAWSANDLVTFKTAPTTSVTSPANSSTYTDATLRTNISFTQAEAATFVKAELELKQGATLLETLTSTIRTGITFKTAVNNGTSYTVRARVQDSNGLWSAWATSTFTVTYQAPVPAVVKTTFLPDSGMGQLDLTIAAPGTGQAAATTVTITRTIDGVTETVVQDYPVSSALTFLDTTPVVRGTNTYTVTTKSSLGAQKTVTADLVTNELRRAYLSKGAGFASVGVFGANLKISEDLSVASDTVQAAGRTKPIGLYGVETSVKLKVDSFIYEGLGSTVDQLRTLLLTPGKACYRDASGRRVFGSVQGGVSYSRVGRANLSFTLIETS